MKITPGVTWGSGDTVNHTQLNAFLTNAVITSGTLDQVALGENALDSLTSGTNNVGIGDDAGTALTDGDENVMVGSDTLKAADSAEDNVVIGYQAMSVGVGEPSRNVAIGQLALQNVTSSDGTEGCGNVAVGRTAGQQLTTGKDNVFVGEACGISVATGYDNVFMGDTAGALLTTDSYQNTLIGASTMNTAVAVDRATAVGAYALQANTADLNVAVGYAAGTNNTSGDDNTYVGSQAGYTNITGTDNTFIGDNAGYYVTAHNNTVLGSQAGANVATGEQNTLLGRGSAGGLTSGSSANVAVGYVAMGTSTADVDGAVAVGSETLKVNTASFNVAMGYRAGLANTSGDDNTYVGSQAGITNITGTDNTFIGDNAGYYVTANNNTALGSDANTTAGATAAYTNTTSLGYAVDPTASNQVRLGNASIASLHCQVSLTVDSDKRIKNNVKTSKIGLDFINALRSVDYKKKNPFSWPDELKEQRFKKEKPDKKPEDDPVTYNGFIAQEVKKVMDAQGITDWDGWRQSDNTMQSLTATALIGPLVKAIQELSAKVVKLEAKA